MWSPEKNILPVFINSVFDTKQDLLYACTEAVNVFKWTINWKLVLFAALRPGLDKDDS